MNKCVFLDRDGVLNQDIEGYLYNPDDLHFPDGVKEGLQRLKEAGYLLVVITNQAGIAKGEYTANDVKRVHKAMEEAYAITFDGLYYSPHHPDFTSNSLLRKPDSLMIEKGIAKYKVDTNHSWMVGDKERDITAGKKAGVRTILVNQEKHPTVAEAHVKCFQEVVDYILTNA